MAEGALHIWDPRLLRGRAGLTARRLAKFVFVHQNVEVCDRSEYETPRKCILQAEKHYAWRKELLEQHLLPLEKLYISHRSKKPKETRVFRTWHYVSSQKEHIF